MKSSIPRGNKKRAIQPVTVTTAKPFNIKISERTLRKRKEAQKKRYDAAFGSGLNVCGFVTLYILLILCALIGGGGIALCGVYFNTNSSSVGWKIAGIVLGSLTLIVSLILILLTVLKQGRYRKWQYKQQESFPNPYDPDFDLDDEEKEADAESRVFSPTGSHISSRHDTSLETKPAFHSAGTTHSTGITHSASDIRTRETASSPITEKSIEDPHLQTITSDVIFCPGCNRLHPSDHQCMYSTRIANGFSTLLRPLSRAPKRDSIAIQTDDSASKTRKPGTIPHTVIDRSLKYSYTTETQTDVTANPRSNITESIILRRVPIPTTKVVVQQPTTKVMIVKVPNTAGQLVIQPPPTESKEEEDIN